MHSLALRTTVLGALLALTACTDDKTHAIRPLSPAEGASKTTVPNNWTIHIDGITASTPVYLGPSPFPSQITAWVTVRDGSGNARYETNVSSWMASCNNLLSCTLTSRSVTGGTQYGYVIGVSPNVEGNLYLGVSRDDLSTATATGTFRGVGVYTINGPSASTYSFSPLQTAQFADTAFHRWGANVSSLYPPSYSFSNPAVGFISSSGFFTATDCGTANVTVTRGGTTANRSVTVSPCRPKVTINGPTLVKPNVTCTYSTTVTSGSGTITRTHWSADGGLGDGSPIAIPTMYLDPANPLTVVVNDANGTFGTAQISITISPSAPNCT